MLTLNAWGGARSARTGGRRRWCRCASSTPTATRCRRARRARSSARGPTVMNGYWNRAELNAERQARRLAPHQRPRPARGRRLDHVHRAQDAASIKSAAENIYPAEVEGCLQHAPGGAGGARSSACPTRSGPRASRPIVVLHDGADGDRRGAHRALPRQHRVVQEAALGRVRRRAAARRLAGRLRRARRAVRRRRLPLGKGS